MSDSKASSNQYIGIDIGGTNTRIGLFQSLECPDFELLTKFPTSQSYTEQIQGIIAALQHLNKEQVASIGVSIAARIAKDGRSVIVAPNLTDYVGKPFAQDLLG